MAPTIDKVLEEAVSALQGVAQKCHDNDEALLELIKATIIRMDLMQQEIDELKLMLTIKKKDVN